MLVLSRQRDESIIITIPAGTAIDNDTNIKVTVVDIRRDKVRAGIEAPRGFPVHREEVYEAIEAERASSNQQSSEQGNEHE